MIPMARIQQLRRWAVLDKSENAVAVCGPEEMLELLDRYAASELCAECKRRRAKEQEATP